MKMRLIAAISAFLILTLTGCGSDNNDGPPPVFVTTIPSDAGVDGYIRRDLDFDTFTVTQGNTQSVRAGLDPVFPDEYRAFLHFPLTSVPVEAVIESAFLEIFVDNIDIQSPENTIPMRIDLVSFSPLGLSGSDFNLSPLTLSPVKFPMFLEDLGGYVRIDVKQLMDAAQEFPPLPDFQVRIMEEFGIVTPGLIEINETTRPPQLIVTYFSP